LNQKLAEQPLPQKETTGNGKSVMPSEHLGARVIDNLEEIVTLLNRGWTLHTVQLPSGIGSLHVRAFMIGPATDEEEPAHKSVMEKISPGHIPIDTGAVVNFEPSAEALNLTPKQLVAATRDMRRDERMATFDSYEYERAKMRMAEARHG
jgi:hypothetical protein